MKEVVKDFVHVENYLDIIRELVQTQDFDSKTGEALQRKRLEWCFGFGYLNYILSDDKLRVGLSTLSSQEGTIFTYKSMLTYEPDIGNALLQVLWLYHSDKPRESQVLKCLEFLVDIITLDENVMEHFSQLPGVTYQYARYTDWIKPFI